MAVRPFKEQRERDKSVFYDTKFFAETHMIEGKEVAIVIDSDRLAKRMKWDIGVSGSDLLFFCKADELGYKPSPGDKLTYDNRYAAIVSVSLDNGEYEIILRFNEGN